MTTDDAASVRGRPDLTELPGAEVCPEGRPIITGPMLMNPGQLEGLRQAGAVHYVNMGERETGWLLTGYDVAAKALADPRLMGDPPQVWAMRTAREYPEEEELDEEDLFFLPEEQHTRLRRMVTRQLTHRRVAGLAPLIQGEIHAVLDRIPQSEPVDFIAAFSRPLPVEVLCTLLALPEDGRRYIRDYVYGWVVAPGSVTAATRHAGLALANYLKALIEERRNRPGDDLISGLVRSEGPDTRTTDVLAAIRLLLVAGHRPVTRLLTNGVLTLLRHPDCWNRLRAEPERVEVTVEELLRFVTPTTLSSRYASEEVEIAGVPVPKGGGVHCALSVVNRDPARFRDPDAFDPDRKSNPHLAFGLGRKHCLGAPLARAQAQLAFGTLVRRFPRMALVRPGTGWERTDDSLRLPVVFEPARS